MGPSIQLGLRVSEETVKALDEVARRKHVTRSVLVKELLANCASLYDFLQQREIRHQPIDGDLSQWLINQLPEATEENWEFLLRVVAHAQELFRQRPANREEHKEDSPK